MMKFLTTTNSRDHSLSGVLLSKYIIKIMLSSVPGSSLRRNSRYFTIAPSLTQSLFILLSFEVCSLLQLSSRAFSSFATSWCVVFGRHLSVNKNIRVFPWNQLEICITKKRKSAFKTRNNKHKYVCNCERYIWGWRRNKGKWVRNKLYPIYRG